MQKPISPYYDRDVVLRAVEDNAHRDIIGGHWDALGELQFRQLIDRGLRPDHKLLDIGCGSLRGGVRFIEYLDPGCYCGLDLNEALLDAGYERELVPVGLDIKLPRQNLRADASFDANSFGLEFDYAIAFSVFTHLPLDLIRACLERSCGVMKPGGVFIATFFEAPVDQPTYLPVTHAPGDITTQAGADPYHQRFSDFVYLCEGLPWDVVYIGDFGHLRGQRLVQFNHRS